MSLFLAFVEKIVITLLIFGVLMWCLWVTTEIYELRKKLKQQIEIFNEDVDIINKWHKEVYKQFKKIEKRNKGEENKSLEEFENLFINEYDYEQFFKDTYGTEYPGYNLYDLVARYGAKKVLEDFKKWQKQSLKD